MSVSASLVLEINYFSTLYTELLFEMALPSVLDTWYRVRKWITTETKEDKEKKHSNFIAQLTV